jgi:hypothetical protein
MDFQHFQPEACSYHVFPFSVLVITIHLDAQAKYPVSPWFIFNPQD